MNRELKFRAWITPWGSDAKPYMQYIPDLQLHVFFGNWERGGYEDAVFQQYTGLKDCNGKEIYEGDILFFQKQDGVWPDQLNRRMEVKYPFVCGNAHLGEIIGNIFETPELLK